MLQVCLSRCCIRFKRVLQVFYLDVAYVCNAFQVFFLVLLQVFQTHVSSVSTIFFCMLQVLHPDVSKVDRVLHMVCRGKREGRERAPRRRTA